MDVACVGGRVGERSVRAERATTAANSAADSAANFAAHAAAEAEVRGALEQQQAHLWIEGWEV